MRLECKMVVQRGASPTFYVLNDRIKPSLSEIWVRRGGRQMAVLQGARAVGVEIGLQQNAGGAICTI